MPDWKAARPGRFESCTATKVQAQQLRGLFNRVFSCTLLNLKKKQNEKNSILIAVISTISCTNRTVL